MTDDPVIERLADHSDMLATLTNELAALQHRVERLEAGIVLAGLGNRFDIERAVARAQRDLEVPDD